MMVGETPVQIAASAPTDRVIPIPGATLETAVPETGGGPQEGRSGAAKHMVMLTNYGAALLYLHAHPEARVRDVAESLRITERATARILADLKTSGHLRVTHAHRRNRYEVTGMLPLHLGDEAIHTIADLVTRISNLTMSAFIGGLTVF